MTYKTRKPRPTDRRIAIPHSSWSLGHRPAPAGAPIAPEDFWSRLGL